MSTEHLAQAIAQIAQTDGDHNTAIARLSLHRRSWRTDPLHCIYGLGVAVVAQGGKQVAHGDQVMHYGPGQSVVTTVDMPVVSHVAQADAAQPFLGMMLTLDARELLQVASDLDLPPLPRDPPAFALSLKPLDERLLDAATRLVRLLQEPLLVPSLAPLIQQEMVVRLLCGPHGPYLRQLVAAGSPSQQVAQAMAWLKQNYVGDVLMDELAARAHMSASTFRLHFRKLTGMGPLQYQKQLRLQAARQLMLNHDLDAGATAARVGYESPSQFSRDYSRLFGDPPQRDIKRLRQAPVVTAG
jgi:AraC-like DNA-binding protein